MKPIQFLGLMLLAALFINAGCTKDSDNTGDETSAEETLGEEPGQSDSVEDGSPAAGTEGVDVDVTQLKAVMGALNDSGVTGVVNFVKKDNSVEISGRLNNLSIGPHGFHIHENGDCSAPDGSSAGGHYNPTKTSHGAPSADKHHVGDMGNLDIKSGGEYNFAREYEFLLIDGKIEHLVGKAVVIHAKGDDFKSQPAGNSGDRIACGVIGADELEVESPEMDEQPTEEEDTEE